MVTNIKPKAAWEKVQNESNTILLDVRTTMEFEYIGHPIGAIHVPLMEAPEWQTDEEFSIKVKRALENISTSAPEDLTILAMCRSGKRSEAAAELLTASEFNSVINVIEGFEGDRDNEKHRCTINGWKFHGLPWEQS